MNIWQDIRKDRIYPTDFLSVIEETGIRIHPENLWG